MPDVPRLLIRGKRSASDRWRSASVSLDGLLDYDEEVGPLLWLRTLNAVLGGCETCQADVLVDLRPSADVMCRIAMSTPWS